jgi:DNA-binding transcriptional LysR family regulator
MGAPRDPDRVLRRLKLRQLRLLVAVGAHGNIQGAARDLGVSQPAATKMIQDLEADFAARLFQRTNRGVLPTEAGKVLIRHAKLLLVQMSNAVQELDDMSGGSSGRVVVGTLLTASARLLPRAITALTRARPGVTVEVVEGTNEVLIPGLRTGEIDMVVGRLSSRRHRADLRQEVLYEERVIAVAGPSHPLAGRSGLSLGDLMDHGWILPPVETTLRRQIDEVFVEAGLGQPPLRVESVSYLTNRMLLQANALIALMPAEVAEEDVAHGRIAPLDWTVPVGRGPVGVSLRDTGALTPAAEAFLHQLRAEAARLRAEKPGDGMTRHNQTG